MNINSKHTFTLLPDQHRITRVSTFWTLVYVRANVLHNLQDSKHFVRMSRTVRHMPYMQQQLHHHSL